MLTKADIKRKNIKINKTKEKPTFFFKGCGNRLT